MPGRRVRLRRVASSLAWAFPLILRYQTEDGGSRASRTGVRESLRRLLLLRCGEVRGYGTDECADPQRRADGMRARPVSGQRLRAVAGVIRRRLCLELLVDRHRDHDRRCQHAGQAEDGRGIENALQWFHVTHTYRQRDRRAEGYRADGVEVVDLAQVIERHPVTPGVMSRKLRLPAGNECGLAEAERAGKKSRGREVYEA